MYTNTFIPSVVTDKTLAPQLPVARQANIWLAAESEKLRTMET
jgi:hypothetical protein